MKGSEPAIVGTCLEAGAANVTIDCHVAILLGTHNGARHIAAQLQSIANQTHQQWSLWVSDDGSTDDTADIVRRFAATQTQPVHLLAGPQQGFSANFMSLVHHPELEADHIAFCDQDDVWLPDHLQRGLVRLSATRPAAPALYCGRTIYIDEDGRQCGESRPAPTACNFPRALAQNVCAGNTMLVNRAGLNLLRQAPPNCVAAHDWLAYLYITAVGGQVVFDATPTVQYRQHRGNAMGENRSFEAKLHRLRRVLAGDLKEWTESNLAVLTCIDSQMTTQARQTVCHFQLARSGPFWQRIAHLRRSGVRRSSVPAQVVFSVALLLGWV